MEAKEVKAPEPYNVTSQTRLTWDCPACKTVHGARAADYGWNGKQPITLTRQVQNGRCRSGIRDNVIEFGADSPHGMAGCTSKPIEFTVIEEEPPNTEPNPEEDQTPGVVPPDEPKKKGKKSFSGDLPLSTDLD